MRIGSALLVAFATVVVLTGRPWRHADPTTQSQPAPIITPGRVAGYATTPPPTAANAADPQTDSQQTPAIPVIHEPNTPNYHSVTPKGGFPPVLDPKQFSDPRVQAAYKMASQVEGVLFQQPCYCHCDQEIGHTCLLDCFTGDHASICETCMQEGVFAYRETKAGKTPGQIRNEIKSGAWKTVKLNELVGAAQ